MKKQLDRQKIKQRIMEIGHKTGAGHVPSAMSVTDLLCSIYDQVDPKKDIVILSKGHGVLAQYVILNELGLFPDEVLATYVQPGGLSEHSTLMPEYGIYASTGSLGHGLPIALGYAIADKKRRVICIMGDGELDEGSNYEAFKLMFDLKLTNVTPVVEINDWQGFKKTSDWTFALVNKDDPTTTFPMYKTFFSVKGLGMGKKYQDKLDSHYAKITDEVMEHWDKFNSETPKDEKS